MDISSLLQPKNILFDETIHSKKDLFRTMAELLEKNGCIKNKKKLIVDLEKREKVVSTGIEDGFGIPHAKSKCVVKPTIAFAHTNEISDYIALDDTKVQCSFLLAIPSDSNDLHLDILSSLSRKLMNEDFRNKLKQAKTQEEVMTILSD
ncbi:PTS sugar transporter subunit IIA [Metabacillus sediminilitoris]|uniref:PTS sugar transporter subunit IIA n=1 Tax=Metabacillus sediminilitoris TaxID=2567941 RepID=A0A4S4BRM0_9BACI|nr:PTS sugar transporter subunit IIA [Metabacillus sediminilitoris]QGQ45482.1 PTS sugar transporter subunit IIA [Metabacillus sediminilitoris]THF77661.1 PTS sugar transporter subunit IIA [Metabacillus sediminilitoris]